MSKHEDAALILQLYDLRREETMRKARTWLAAFNPETVQDIVDAGTGENNAYLRMVMSYWDMAASLVITGAIDADAFRAAHSEVFGTFSKIHPFLAELRAVSGEPDFCKHVEAVVLGAPDGEAILARRLAALRAAAKARK